MSNPVQRIRVVDSHTAGEPTRVVIEGGPDLGTGPLADRLERFRREHDRFRRAVVNEPRGSDVLVGALLSEPHEPGCDAGVIFFNNVGYLGMCGHGLIGMVATLAHLGRTRPGPLRIDTPVGVVSAVWHGDGAVTVENVPARRARRDVEVRLGDGRVVHGDVAWGGNWFFLVKQHGLRVEPAALDELTAFAVAVRTALNAQGHPEVDHIELTGPPASPSSHSRNFVLCPGLAYDRSPCGTGTSAHVACLAEDGRLAEGEEWVQEGILGTAFHARFTRRDGLLIPEIRGSAFVTGEASLLVDSRDPFAWGIPSPLSL